MNECNREVQVTQQLEVLNTATEDCWSVLRTLHSRLEGVLQPQIPQAKEIGIGSVEQSLVPVASQIRDIRYKVSEMMNLASSIINRLEL